MVLVSSQYQTLRQSETLDSATGMGMRRRKAKIMCCPSYEIGHAHEFAPDFSKVLAKNKELLIL